jgi:hypothetical protein
MVYEANPAAISHQVSGSVAFTMSFGNTIDSVRYVYSLYPEAAAERFWQWRDILHYAAERQSRKYSPGSQLPSREHIGENAGSLLPYIHL